MVFKVHEKSSFIFVILENVTGSKVVEFFTEGMKFAQAQLYYSYILSFADTKKYESRILHLNSDLSVCNVRSWTKLQFPFLTKIQNRINKKKLRRKFYYFPLFYG